jgi:hypothetical protein
MLKMNAVKSKKAKTKIEKYYDAKILKLAGDSKQVFSNVDNALIGYTMGFGKVKAASVFGTTNRNCKDFRPQKPPFF